MQVFEHGEGKKFATKCALNGLSTQFDAFLSSISDKVKCPSPRQFYATFQKGGLAVARIDFKDSMPREWLCIAVPDRLYEDVLAAGFQMQGAISSVHDGFSWRIIKIYSKDEAIRLASVVSLDKI